MSSGQSRSNDVAQSAIPARFRKIIEVDGERFNIVMQRTAYDAMKSGIEVPENGSASHNNILNVAMLLFMNYLDAATSMSESCGGGGSPGSGWGRDTDEDDREWGQDSALWHAMAVAQRWMSIDSSDKCVHRWCLELLVV